MKGLVYEEYAPDDDFKKILNVKDVDDPKPKPDEVIFKVKATALNYNDIWAMRGQPIPAPLPHISGSDAAGDVIAVGDDVKNIKVSDRVVSHSNMSCRACSPLGWIGWISLQSKGLSTVFSNTTVQKHQFFCSHLSSQFHSHIHR